MIVEPTECPICHAAGMERLPRQVLDYSTTTPTLFTVWRCTSGKCADTRVYRRAEPNAEVQSVVG